MSDSRGSKPSPCPCSSWSAKTLAEDLVYSMTARLWAADTRQRLRLALGAETTAEVTIDGAFDGLEAPLHPGAERFYRERGLLP